MQQVYLDNAATTRCEPEVARLALELMTRDYGNPSSLHTKGLEAQLRLDTARRQLAAALGCQREEVLFTSGGTESNNLAILGAVRARPRAGKTLVCMATAHSSVRAPLKHLETQGYTLRLIPPLPDGNSDVDALVEAVDGDTVLLCLELVGSEVGAIAPVQEIVRRARRKAPTLFVHCDGVQALGKLSLSTPRLGVDTLAVSAHKIGAPKGCGALFLKAKTRILPLQYGGGQERGLRPGTENTALAAAFGLAAELRCENLEENLVKVGALREYFVNKAAATAGLCINSPENATPYISNVSLPGYRSETLLHYLAERGVYVSSGSACSRGAASHVLTAMELPPARVDSALRISLSPHSTREELGRFFQVLEEAKESIMRSKT